MADTTGIIVSKNQKTESIKGHLRWAALFLGELRDGLTMVRTRLWIMKNEISKVFTISFFLNVFYCILTLTSIYEPRQIMNHSMSPLSLCFCLSFFTFIID
jgi:hypothetical protein